MFTAGVETMRNLNFAVLLFGLLILGALMIAVAASKPQTAAVPGDFQISGFGGPAPVFETLIRK
jgi:hypothetical protein